MRLEATVEVVGADAGIDDGDDDEDERDDSEEGHRGPGRYVLGEGCGGIHSIKLEAEICHGREKEQLQTMGLESKFRWFGAMV